MYDRDKDPHKIGLDYLELAHPSRAVLENANLGSLGAFLLFGRHRMSKQRGCGPAVLRNIEVICNDHGYGF